MENWVELKRFQIRRQVLTLLCRLTFRKPYRLSAAFALLAKRAAGRHALYDGTLAPGRGFKEAVKNDPRSWCKRGPEANRCLGTDWPSGC